MWLYIIIAVVVLLALYVLITYNSLVKMNNMVKEAFATMDVYLKKRWDLIPNLVETVKGYAKHEQETLNSITNIRTGSYSSMSADEKINANQQLAQGISKLMLIAEAYPQLKANENFLDLNAQLSAVENDISNARKYYNAVVRDFNNKVQTVPSNIIAGMFGFKEKNMFEANTAERENVSVKF